MYKHFVFFLILYLSGMALSPTLAGDTISGKKTFLYSLAEDGLGESEIQHDWREKLPDFPSLSFAHRLDRSDFFSFCHSIRLAATQNTKGLSRPLYLLFQSLLFYELS